MPDVWNEGGDIVVSLKTAKSQRAEQAEYAQTDLASGYPTHLIWTTKDGRRIAIPNLSNQHLLNIIAYLRRRAEDYRKMVIAKIARGVAETTVITRLFDIEDWILEEWEEYIQKAKGKAKEVFNMEPEALLRKYIPIYQHLLEECYRRKLLIEVDSSKIAHQTTKQTEIGRRYQPKRAERSQT